MLTCGQSECCKDKEERDKKEEFELDEKNNLTILLFLVRCNVESKKLSNSRQERDCSKGSKRDMTSKMKKRVEIYRYKFSTRVVQKFELNMTQ